ncbi:MAG: DUF2156 domain-containing protein [Muribaculaceae bacterium]|nr:DUF2156 domain-containing protein [Muribaculaceae bacterium]
MLELKTPDISDRDAVCALLRQGAHIASDSAFANIFLLRHKYHTLMGIRDGFLFRYYGGTGSRRGYAFPIGRGNCKRALQLIADDARESGRALEFCLVTDSQQAALRDFFGKDRLTVTPHRSDADYVYSAEQLATLAGQKMQKKRNHCSRFQRTYENIELRSLDAANFSDAMAVADKWLEGNNYEWAEGEHAAIAEALCCFDVLGLSGDMLYADGQPAAMTIATEILPDVCDILYEKAIDEYAENGAYAAVNRLFAETLAQRACLINREEDMGVPNLRKSKLSYHPLFLIEKSHVSVKAPRPLYKF